jgi:hypothetical protein
MPDVYHCFLKGHRIMVQIQSSWFRWWIGIRRRLRIFRRRRRRIISATERIYREKDAASEVEVLVER